ncbi:MAG: hypothetical protein WBB34_10715 [Xanthobacteraceae bacterium]
MREPLSVLKREPLSVLMFPRGPAMKLHHYPEVETIALPRIGAAE